MCDTSEVAGTELVDPDSTGNAYIEGAGVGSRCTNTPVGFGYEEFPAMDDDGISGGFWSGGEPNAETLTRNSY
jgi:hypothetical protein